MDSESRHVFFQPVEVLRQERWVVHAPNYECGYVNFCTPTRRAVARRRSCETIGSVIVQTAGDRTGLRPSLDIFGFVSARKPVLPSDSHHPPQELETICGQNLLCLGATEEFHIAARLLLHGIGTQQPGKDGWMRCIDDDQP